MTRLPAGRKGGAPIPHSRVCKRPDPFLRPTWDRQGQEWFCPACGRVVRAEEVPPRPGQCK